jgi:hypothetical protein
LFRGLVGSEMCIRDSFCERQLAFDCVVFFDVVCPY